MGLGDIISDISGIISLFTSQSAKKYPSELPSIKIDQITNRPKFNDKNWKTSRGYSFQVMKVKDGGRAVEVKGWQEFRLQINPQELQQDEIFAIEVTPTFRGVVVEHHGTILKDIVISGTTGISPNRKEGGSFANSGNPILATGHSGYEEFHELRSYFRVYVEAKRIDPKDGGELRMVFRNYKDNEYLYVEPQKFTMKRSAKRPFLYDYSISMKGIGVADVDTTSVPSFPQNVVNFIEDVQDTLTAATKIINGAIGIISRFERNITDTILGPIQALNSALKAIAGGRAQLLGQFGISQRSLMEIRNEISRVSTNYKDALGISTPGYDKSIGWSSTTAVTSPRAATYQESAMLNAFRKIDDVLIQTLNQVSLFEEDVFNSNAKVINIFNNKFSIQESNSTRVVGILGTDNIQSIAARELGDPDRFRDIVILNNLKPPYISLVGGRGVLKPGDKIMLPQSAGSTPNAVTRGRDYNITRGMNEDEKNLGVDLRLTKDADIALSNTHDFDLTAGIDNMSQSIAIKIYLEPGSLKRHQSIGSGLQIGTKATSQILQLTRSRVLTSLGTDPRIESIPYAEMIQESGTTFLNMVIKLRHLDQPIPVPLKISN